MKKLNSLLALFLVSFVGLAGFASAHAGDDSYGHHEMMGMYGMMSGGYGFGWMIFGWIIGILWIVLLVLAVVWLIKQIQKK